MNCESLYAEPYSVTSRALLVVICARHINKIHMTSISSVHDGVHISTSTFMHTTGVHVSTYLAHRRITLHRIAKTTIRWVEQMHVAHLLMFMLTFAHDLCKRLLMFMQTFAHRKIYTHIHT